MISQQLFLRRRQLMAQGVNAIPAGIAVKTPPTKLVYDDGDSIIQGFADIVVELIDENGNTFMNEDYPTGIVPFSELEFPIETAVWVDPNESD